jgi:gluconokinase
MVILLMGVAGSGKSTIGIAVAKELDWTFCDADTLHPRANVEKMANGIPLDDQDRAPWLAIIHDLIVTWIRDKKDVVLACSALKGRYRQQLYGDIKDPHSNLKAFYLKGSFELIRDRLQKRRGHYMKEDMLQSQFAALEEPEDAIVIEISLPPRAIVEQIISIVRQPSATLSQQNV